MAATRTTRIASSALVELAAADVVAHLDDGIGVAVHCMGGRGRAGTVIGVALVRLGHDPDTVVDYLDRSPKARGRRGWPESPWQAGRRAFGQVTTPAPLSASSPDQHLRVQGACMRSTAHEPESDPKNRALPNAHTVPS